MNKPFRFIVAATPKSGGEWVAGLLSNISGSVLKNFQRIDSHVLAETTKQNEVITTRELPNNSLIDYIDRAGFQKITVIRHPFDVLINLLLAANVDSETSTYWRDSALQTEKRLRNVMPRHPMFLEYAVSSRFKDLLAISSLWKKNVSTHSLTFEGLAYAPLRELERVVDCKRFTIEVPIAEIIDKKKKGQPSPPSTLSFTSATSGVWRRLIPAIQAERLASHLSIQMTDLGYESDPDIRLTADDADANWYKFMAGEQIRPLTESLQNYLAQRQVIGVEVDISLQVLVFQINSIINLINLSSTSRELLVAELKKHQKEALKISTSLRHNRLTPWRRFSQILHRLMDTRS